MHTALAIACFTSMTRLWDTDRPSACVVSICFFQPCFPVHLQTLIKRKGCFSIFPMPYCRCFPCVMSPRVCVVDEQLGDCSCNFHSCIQTHVIINIRISLKNGWAVQYNIIKLMTSSATGAVGHFNENDPMKDSTFRRQNLRRMTRCPHQEQCIILVNLWVMCLSHCMCSFWLVG